MDNILLETERLYIGEFKTDMALAVSLGSLDEDTRKFLPDEVFKTEEEAKETLEYLISQYHDGSPLVYPLILKKDHSFIGYVEAVRLKDNSYETGYHINKEYRRQGFAKEALSVFVPYILVKKNIDEIYGIVDADNIASIKVLENTGFKKVYEGIARYHHQEKQITRYIYRMEK